MTPEMERAMAPSPSLSPDVSPEEYRIPRGLLRVQNPPMKWTSDYCQLRTLTRFLNEVCPRSICGRAGRAGNGKLHVALAPAVQQAPRQQLPHNKRLAAAFGGQNYTAGMGRRTKGNAAATTRRQRNRNDGTRCTAGGGLCLMQWAVKGRGMPGPCVSSRGSPVCGMAGQSTRHVVRPTKT